MALDRPKRASCIKVRYLIMILATLCPIVCYIGRQNLSLAIVAMVDESKDSEADHIANGPETGHEVTTSLPPSILKATERNPAFGKNQTGRPLNGDQNSDTCPLPTKVNADGDSEISARATTYGPRYRWKASEKSLIFECFFLAYVVFQIPGARVAETLGAKWVLATAGLGTFVINALSPWAASQHVYALAAARGIMGICQTALYPSIYVLYSRWLPPSERRQALPILGAAAYIGSIVASTATGYFSEKAAYGWHYAFYVPSVVCALWSVAWIFIAASEPRQHKFISWEEIDYIESRMETRTQVKESAEKGAPVEVATSSQPKSPSWKKLFTSQAIWAMMAGFFGSNLAFNIILLLLPSYLNGVLLIEPLKNGLINSVLYTLFVIATPIVGVVSSYMIETRTCGLTHLQTRKFFECTAIFGQSICFILIPLFGCDTNLVLSVLYVQIVVYSFTNGGEVQMPSELSLDFAGTIYAIGNCVGSSCGFIVPRIFSLIVTDTYDRSLWNTFFYAASVICALGGFIFLFFARNDMQDFSEDSNEANMMDRRLSKNDQLSNVMAQNDLKLAKLTRKPSRREVQISI